MKVRKIDHIGIIVNDFPAAKAFFLDLGLEAEEDGEWEAEGKPLDKIVGLDGVKNRAIMLRTPDGEVTIELIQFYTPSRESESHHLPANVPGLRHLAFVVEDLEGLVTKMKKKGMEMVGEIVDYEDSYRLCYVRGPEGIILELAEELN